MAKTVITTRIEESLLERLKEIQERKLWTFTTTVEQAIEQFVSQHEAPAEQPRVITINGITYTQQEMAEAA